MYNISLPSGSNKRYSTLREFVVDNNDVVPESICNRYAVGVRDLIAARRTKKSQEWQCSGLVRVWWDTDISEDNKELSLGEKLIIGGGIAVCTLFVALAGVGRK